MEKKQQLGLFFLILGSVALSFLNSPLSEIFFDDKEIFKYAGLVIYKGGVPYRDFFDHKPPLIYFFNALWPVSAWIPWLMDAGIVLFATILFYQLCKKKNLARPWVLPLIFNLLIRYSLVSFGNGMTREYTAAFLLIFFCIMEGNSPYKYFFLGLLTGLTFWMQQDALITLAPFLCYSLFAADTGNGKIGKRLLSVTVGFAGVSIPLIFYFIAHHSLTCLWKDAFLFNLHAPGHPVGFPEKLKALKHAVHEAEFEMAFYTALILGTACLFLGSKRPGLLYAALLALFLSFSGEYLSGRLAAGNAFIYYLLPLSATIPILVWVVFNESSFSFFDDKKVQLLFYFLLSTTLFLGTLRYAAGFSIQSHDELPYAGLPEIEYLKTQSLTDDQLYVFDDSNLIFLYNYFRILSPSPWIYHYFWGWSKDWDRDEKNFKTILQDLQLHKTRFVLDCSGAKNNFRNRPEYREWQQFLQSRYSMISTDSSNRILWRIK
jgi:hypothetical protein